MPPTWWEFAYDHFGLYNRARSVASISFRLQHNCRANLPNIKWERWVNFDDDNSDDDDDNDDNDDDDNEMKTIFEDIIIIKAG